MAPKLVDVVKALIPTHDVRDVSDPELDTDYDTQRVELTCAGGLQVGITFDIMRDMTIDYTKFTVAPFVLDENGDRKLGHWFNWPFDHMYMEVSPEKLQRLFAEMDAYKV